MAPGAMPPAAPSLQAATARAVPVIRYEASAKPLLPFEREEPWWAFLVRYKNIQMTLLALGFWVAMILVHTYLTRLTWHRGVVKFSMVGTPPLHDLLHEVLPNTQPLRVIPEVGHVLPVLYLSGLMLYHFDQRSLDCFRTFLVSHGVLIFLRAISFAGTLLPDASQQCHVSLFVGSCHDLIFSGHVTIMLICVLLAQHYYEIPPVLRVFVGLDAAIVCFFVISSRNHYTVDVVLAVVVTLLVYLAFTRHPFLVSLCVETPVNVLALPTLLDAGQRGGVCGCVGPHDDPPLRTTREGYPVLGDGEALRRMSEHAFGALRLLGLRPSLTMRMVDAEGKPLPGGGVGLTEAALTGSATGATGGAASAGLGSTVTAGSASASTAGFESLPAGGFAAHSHDARNRHGHAQRVLGSLHAHRERDSRERDSDADGDTPVHAHTAAAMRGAGAAAGVGHGSVTALGHSGDRDAALRQAARSRGVSAAELAAWQQQQALLGAWGHATASGVGVGAGAGSSLRHRHAGAVGHEAAIGAPWLHAPAGSHAQIGAQMAAQAQLHGKQARHSTPAAPVLSGSSSAPRPPRTGVTSAGIVVSPAGGSAQRRSPAAAAPQAVAATVAAPGSASKSKGKGHSQPGSPLPSTGASGSASGSGLGADAHAFAVPPALTVSALHGGGTGGSDSLSSHSHSHSHGYSGVHSAAHSVSSAGSAGGSSTGSAGASGTGSAAGGAVGSARGAGAAAAPFAHRSAGPSPSASAVGGGGSDVSAGRSAPGSRRGSESSAAAAGPALGRTATAARRSGTGVIGYGAVGAGTATGPLPPPLSPVSSGGSLPASPDLPAHAHPHGHAHAHPHSLSLPVMHAHPHGSGPHPLVLPGAATAVAGAGPRRPGPVPLSPRTAAAAQAALSISLRRRARALSDMAASEYRLLAAQAEAEAEAEGGMGLADDVDVEVDFDADAGGDAGGAAGAEADAAAGALAADDAADAADADAAADAEVEAEAVEAAAEEYYEMEAVLAHLIAARHARHTPNRQHLASELAAAMSRVRRSARRLLQPVSHITGWVRGFGGAAPEEGPADADAEAGAGGAGAGDAETGEDGSASATATDTDSAGTGSA